jgi:hypothetical protein
VAAYDDPIGTGRQAQAVSLTEVAEGADGITRIGSLTPTPGQHALGEVEFL